MTNEEYAIRMATDDVRLLPIRRQAVNSLRARRRMIEEDAYSLSSAGMSAVPIHGGGNKNEDRLIRSIAAQDALKAQEDAILAMVEETERALGKIREDERALLTALLIDGKTVTETMKKLHISRAEVYRKKKRAARNLAMALGYVVGR